ncbi:MAG: divergent polysaccharide deacetylase family protein [Hahellaceae bacterium]|nr:divergent polysaccharide deacetylase family protein [Hahellaceae bacterium]
MRALKKTGQIAACLIALVPTSGQAEPEMSGPPTIAIIIDDMGNTLETNQQAINLPAPITFAFLPKLQHTPLLAEQAYAKGHEIILHAPMENQHNLPLGPMALTSHMDSTSLSSTLRESIASIPYISGVNNHMGSLLTMDRLAMTTVMAEINRYPLYFVDSRTTPDSVAQKVAEAQGIPTLARDIFLDNETSIEAIHKQFTRLLEIARQKGTAIAIGHPYPETVHYLEQALPGLGELGISIASVKGIWAIRHNSQPMFAEPYTPSRSAIIARNTTPTTAHQE